MGVLSAAFIVKPVDSINMFRFMIAAGNKERARIGHLERQQSEQTFN